MSKIKCEFIIMRVGYYKLRRMTYLVTHKVFCNLICFERK